ncbi:hypothetical protein CYMTET_32806 [Cymbomonas tetramitiformis]|uniref:Uncharacterized protein n=1 Tax=Cymbomonas tetramitiformis TaxID=36881 RepID=A0AAE0KRK3_9CHLO|nr:hypothetical protein CYMTET_32806 [Cymbomonas tetramitiformis]
MAVRMAAVGWMAESAEKVEAGGSSDRRPTSIKPTYWSKSNSDAVMKTCASTTTLGRGGGGEGGLRGGRGGENGGGEGREGGEGGDGGGDGAGGEGGGLGEGLGEEGGLGEGGLGQGGDGFGGIGGATGVLGGEGGGGDGAGGDGGTAPSTVLKQKLVASHEWNETYADHASLYENSGP